MADDDARAGEELARAWLQGKSELINDLAALVDGMSQPLDATAKGFLVTVGNAARMAKRAVKAAEPEFRDIAVEVLGELEGDDPPWDTLGRE